MPGRDEKNVSIAGRQVRLTNLGKRFWPDGTTKAHLVKYYAGMAPYMLPHLENRPLVMKRYPDGVDGGEFYQKECPSYAPPWIETQAVKHGGKVVNYVLCNDAATLVWLANQACIEIHVTPSGQPYGESPDTAVMDLDPAPEMDFADVLGVALLVRGALAEFGLAGYPKTSGAGGLHLYIPIEPVYPWPTVTRAMEYIANLVAAVAPEKTTTERVVRKRGNRLYLDYLQNGRGKTMVAPYSLRALPGAPVSTPLLWDEVERGDVRPQAFNISTIWPRLEKHGDLLRDVLIVRQSLDELLQCLPRKPGRDEHPVVR